MTLNNLTITREQTSMAVRALVYQAEARRRGLPDCADEEACRQCGSYCEALSMSKQQLREE